jgi:nucleoside-diphosphate-sugar epimerase
LLARGDTVRVLARADYPELRALGVDARRGDIADPDTTSDAARGCDVVFHVAAKAGIWGSKAEYEHANVQGTVSVIKACRANGIERLVFTSSPSVVYGGQPIEGGDESLPYPARYEADYPRTKAASERLVLEANEPRLRTVALRPHLIWGPGDTNLVPRIVARARAGKLRLVGTGEAIIDTVFIENAADAHLLAADRLLVNSPVCGKPYFITNGEPGPVKTIINGILRAAGLPEVTQSVPPRVAYAAGSAIENTWRLLGRKDEPPMTRFLAKQLSTAHWFNISAARRDLGYSPKVSIAAGLEKLAESFVQSRR